MHDYLSHFAIRIKKSWVAVGLRNLSRHTVAARRIAPETKESTRQLNSSTMELYEKCRRGASQKDTKMHKAYQSSLLIFLASQLEPVT